MLEIKNIIWDWNGTILNDIELSINCINKVLSQRNIPELTHEKYSQIFGFPVKDYYLRAGLISENESFEIAAKEFIDLYHSHWDNCSVFEEAKATLDIFKQLNKNQFILSAMENNSLQNQVKYFGLNKYFIHIQGIDNHFASSKVEIGKLLIDKQNIKPTETLLIGDTTHDYEVAQHLGVKCLLISNGHQNFNRLNEVTSDVLPSLEFLKRMIS